MNMLVKYHNDLNKIRINNFSEQDLNLFMIILSKVKAKSCNEVEIRFNEFENLCNKKLTRKELFNVIKELKNKIFNLDFTKITETQKEIEIETIHLFSKFVIHAVKDNPDDGWDNTTNLTRVEFVVNPLFEHLLNDLFQNFTRFELAEFIALSGKYTKTLYRLLKQYRQTGQMQMGWSEFLYVMDIPLNYEQHNINKHILKPAIKELTKERNLFDTRRVPFKNLQYEKIKEKGFGGRGQGGKVVGIKFTFKPETKEIETKLEEENPKNNIDIEKLNKLYKGRNYCDSSGNYKIIDLIKKGASIYATLRSEAGHTMGKDFTSVEELENALD